MADPEIAPLAQRLAEENNVEWRSLHGTGQGGRIVERDVLEYLARVMAGEEDVDPTAEPLPEGMEAWPEERAAPPEGGAGTDPETTAAPDADAEPAPSGADDAKEEDLLLAGDDLIDARGGGEPGLLVGEESGAAEAEDAAPSRAPEADRGEPNLFDEGGEGVAAEEARPAGGGAPDLFEGDLEWEDDGGVQAEVGFDPENGFDLGRQDDAAEAGDESASGPGFDFGGLPGDEAFTDASPAAEERTARPGPEAETADEVPREDAPREPREDAPREGVGAVADAPAPDLSYEPATREGGIAEPPTPEQAATADVGAGLPLARTRQVLRRQVVLDGALAAQRAAVLEGGNEATALGALLLLAARRVDSPLSGGRVALARVRGEGGVEAVSPPASGLSELSHALAGETDTFDPANVELWVADMTDVGLDDVVLDVDGAQLVLGRVLRDGDDGAARAMLTLAGEVGVAEGAAFLARIAERLEDPLRLLA